MKLTRFYKLRQAIGNLDVNLITNKIKSLEEHLMQKGLALEPENTAITQEGIYYIDPDTGMATKGILYISEHSISLDKSYEKEVYLTGYSDLPTIETLHPYHIVACNVLTRAENDGWPEPYKITQRTTGSFHYQIMNKSKRSKTGGYEVYQEIENQRLLVCKNCLMKVTSILDGAVGVKRDAFELQTFFDVDFTRSWNSHEKLSKEKGILEGIYPKDWLEICRIRQEQVQFHCEGCFTDLSDPDLQEFLHVHHADHINRQVAYVKLECLCIACLAEHPERSHLKELPSYTRYLRTLQKIQPSSGRLDDESYDRDAKTLLRS